MNTTLNRRFFGYTASAAVFSLSSLATSSLAISSLAMASPASELSQAEKELFGLVRHPDIRGKGFNLRAQAADAFEALSAHALKDGIELYSYSSYRSFEHQSKIWNRKYQLYSARLNSPQEIIREIILYSTVPGTSRHHWGTDLDVIDLKPKRPQSGVLSARHFQPGGAYEKLYEWLLQHGKSYGFYETYPNDPNRPGFEYEPWHWSFAEISIPLLERYLSLPLHEKLPLSGLQGQEHLTEAFFEDYKKNWGLGIHPQLLPSSFKS